MPVTRGRRPAPLRSASRQPRAVLHNPVGISERTRSPPRLPVRPNPFGSIPPLGYPNGPDPHLSFLSGPTLLAPYPRWDIRTNQIPTPASCPAQPFWLYTPIGYPDNGVHRAGSAKAASMPPHSTRAASSKRCHAARPRCVWTAPPPAPIVGQPQMKAGWLSSWARPQAPIVDQHRPKAGRHFPSAGVTASIVDRQSPNASCNRPVHALQPGNVDPLSRSSALQWTKVGSLSGKGGQLSAIAGLAIDDCNLHLAIVKPAIDDCNLQLTIVKPVIGNCNLHVAIVKPEIRNCNLQLTIVKLAIDDCKPEIGNCNPTIGDCRPACYG